jgi:hypothetical protein
MTEDGKVTDITIKEAVLDPKWTGAQIDLDGHVLLLLSIEHPRHGRIDMILPRQSAANLRDWLEAMT